MHTENNVLHVVTPVLMNSLSHYSYIGSGSSGGAVVPSSSEAESASGSAGSGGSSGGSGGNGGSGNNNGSSPFPASSDSSSSNENKIVVTLSTENRNKQVYPLAAQCRLALPETLEQITKVVLTSAEVPGTEYNVMAPKLFFSELHETIWVPFAASLSSGNYAIETFVDGLAASLTSAKSLTSEYAAVRNTYSTSYSNEWGRVAITSDHVCPFTLQFRTAPVRVTAARVSATGQYITVTISDSEKQPLSEGAGVNFAPGNGVPVLACVVQAVDTTNRTLDLRVVPSITTLASTTSKPEVGQTSTGKAIVPQFRSIQNTFGTSTPGAVIPISVTAVLIPFSTDSDGTNNLGDLFGFGTLVDRTSAQIGISQIAAIQTPFNKDDGSIVVTTEFPHFAVRGDIIQIQGTNTLFDTIHQVVLALDETHIQITPSLKEFLNSMPQLIIYLDGDINPPTTIDLVSAVTVVKSKSGTAELSITMKDKSANYDMSTFANKTIRFAVDAVYYNTSFRPEFAYATASSGTVSKVGGSAYYNTMQMFFVYPTFVLTTINATLTRVANASLTQFSQTGSYYPKCLVSPARFDFSRRHRFIYLQLTVDQKVCGNMMIGSLVGQRLFAKLTLSSGRDAITFLNRFQIEGTAKIAVPVASARDVGIAVYNSDGSIYDFTGSECSFTLEFTCKSPIE